MASQLTDRDMTQMAEATSVTPLKETPPHEQETSAPPGGLTPPAVPFGKRPRRLWRSLLIVLALLLVVAGSILGGIIGARLVPANTTAVTGQQVALSARVADLQQAVENVSQGVQPSVVEITSRGNSPLDTVRASGVIMTADGYIVTNDHVVNGYSTYTVTLSNGKTLSARLIGEATQDDLALLKIEATDLMPIRFANSSGVVVGQFVVALGSPVGLARTATFGIVSALNRTESELLNGSPIQLPGLIQTSATLNPGNSGGALLDLNGQLIGIPALRVEADSNESDIDGISFAISANRIKYVATQLIQYGRLVNSNQGFLGIGGQGVTPAAAAARMLSVERGVLVTGFTRAVSGSSPAQRAGVHVGDVITAVNGAPIATNNDLAGATMTLSPGTRVMLTIMRDSQQQTISATLGERPVSA